MFKLIGAIITGTLVMLTVAYFVARPKEDRQLDANVLTSLFGNMFQSIKTYFFRLNNPEVAYVDERI